MKKHKIFVTSMRVLATVAVLFQRFYFGQIGAGAGLLDGLVIYAIWSPFYSL